MHGELAATLKTTKALNEQTASLAKDLGEKIPKWERLTGDIEEKVTWFETVLIIIGVIFCLGS